MLPITVLDLGEPQYVIIWLHGLGANGNDFVDFIPQLGLPPESPLRFVFPDAPSQPVTINGGYVMPAWFDIFSADKDAEEDIPGLLAAEQMIHELIDDQLNKCQLSAKQLLLAGFSQGGALALFTALRYPQRMAGVLALSTYLPAQSLLDESRHEANADTPILLAHGDQDDIVLPHFARKSRQWLMQRNYPVTWRQYPMSHTVCAQEAVDIRDCLLEFCSPG